MVKITCNCLNIKIHAKHELVPVDKDTLGINLKKSNNFFDQDLFQVLLNLEGIQVEQRYLATETSFEGWTITGCINCHMLTHASQQQSDVILVNSKLPSDDATIEQLVNSPDYSVLYRIVLKEVMNGSHAAFDLALRNAGDIVQKIQKHLDTYLQTEKNLMEEKIRQFEVNERDKFSVLETKARRDKNALIGAVISNTSKSVSDSLEDAMIESPIESCDLPAVVQSKHITIDSGDCRHISPIVSPLTFGRKIATDVIDEEGFRDEIPDHFPRVADEISRSESQKKRDFGDVKQVQMESGPSADDVFQYDPGFQEDPTQPFSESDDEDVSDTDDDSSTTADEVLAIKKFSPPTAVFSTSVPIRVPPSCNRQNSRFEFEDEGVVPTDAAAMAASIQALARSVHDDGSGIFGELPPSRSRTRSRILSSQGSDKH